MTNKEMAIMANELMDRSDAFRKMVIFSAEIDIIKGSEESLDELIRQNMAAAILWLNIQAHKDES